MAERAAHLVDHVFPPVPVRQWVLSLTEPRTRAEPASAETRVSPTSASDAGRATGKSPNLLWAQLMQRSFGFDVLACSRCGGRRRLIAVIEDARVMRQILTHLGLPTEVPAARPSRAPPLPFDGVDPHRDQDVPAVRPSS
jgi:hypothetical protein